MKKLIEIVKSLEDSGLLLKGVRETIQYEAKEQKGGFLSMLLRTLGASLLGNTLTGWGVMAKSIIEVTKSKRQGRGVNRAGVGAIVKSVSKETKSKRQGRGTVRAGYGNKKKFEKQQQKTKRVFIATSSFN